MKRNTTPTVPIRINMPFDDVQAIDFVFKYEKNDYAPELLRVTYGTREKIPVEVSSDGKSFKVLMKLGKEDTRKLVAGKVYMDTDITLSGGITPETSVVEIDDIKETLFGEVYDK